jgi:hypothetical protein
MNAMQTLQIISIAIAALRAIPGIDPKVLAQIQIADEALNKALAAHQQAQLAVDPTLLHPIDPVV